MQKKNIIISVLLSLVFYLTSCVTPAQRDAMQRDIEYLDREVENLNNKLNAQSKQTQRNTKTTISSQTELQVLQSNIAENSGDIDALKMRVQKIEENSSQNTESYLKSIEANTKAIEQLQRQIALLEAKIPTPETKVSPSETVKKSFQPKNVSDVTKALKTDYEKGWFKNVILKASMVIQSSSSTPEMVNEALKFRGEAKYKLADYSGAVVDLTNFLNKSTSDNAKARALLLIGDSYVFLKKDSAAKSFYQECAQTYAKTSEGKACSERVKNLSN